MASYFEDSDDDESPSKMITFDVDNKDDDIASPLSITNDTDATTPTFFDPDEEEILAAVQRDTDMARQRFAQRRSDIESAAIERAATEQRLANRKLYITYSIVGVIILLITSIIVGVIFVVRHVNRPDWVNRPEAAACQFLQYPTWNDCTSATSFIKTTTSTQKSTSGNSIPSEIGLLTNLTKLTLFSEGLTGTIPSTLVNLVHLTWLDVSDNPQLGGSIPSLLCSTSIINIEIDCGGNIACSCCKSGISPYNNCP